MAGIIFFFFIILFVPPWGITGRMGLEHTGKKPRDCVSTDSETRV